MIWAAPEVGDHTPWRRWFAWYPVRVGGNRIAWLETVERRAVFVDAIPTSWIGEFRMIGDESYLSPHDEVFGSISIGKRRRGEPAPKFTPPPSWIKVKEGRVNDKR